MMPSSSSSSVFSPSAGRKVPKSLYKANVDFERLAEQDADFAAFYKPLSSPDRGSCKPRRLNFQDPEAVQQLTKSILKVNFGLHIKLHNNRLCPPVPIRWNYVEWIQRLLDSTASAFPHDRYRNERKIVGLDIGVGASCIYGLLACATRPTWHMFGTDIDTASLTCAQENVNINHFDQRIELCQTTAEDHLIPLESIKINHLDFVMTNPPFYSNKAELIASYEFKSTPPSAVCTGSDKEMICDGGDLGFVTRLFEESLILGDRVQWYTAMLGKLSSLKQIITKIKDQNINNFAVTSLASGNKTKRWAVGWSFRDLRPRNDIARGDTLASHLLPAATAISIPMPLMSATWAGNHMNEILAPLDVRWIWDSESACGVVQATNNVWSRTARRKRKFQAMDGYAESALLDTASHCPKAALTVQIVCEEEKVTANWLSGQDQILYQSFCGMLKSARRPSSKINSKSDA